MSKYTNLKAFLLLGWALSIFSGVHAVSYWGTPASFENVSITSEFPIALWMNDNGDSIVAWYDGSSNVNVAQLSNGSTTWSPAVTVATGQLGVTTLVVALDKNNNAALAWNTLVTGIANMNLAYRPSNSSWTSPTQIASSFNYSNLSIAIDDNGIPAVCWADNRLSPPETYVYVFLSGSWQQNESFTMSVGEGANVYAPYIIGNDQGNLAVFWWISPGQTVFSTRVNGVWSTSPTLIDVAHNSATDFPAAINNSNQAILFTIGHFNNSDLGYNFTVTSPGLTVTNLGNSTSNIYLGSSAIDALGNGTTVWAGNPSPNFSLFSAFYNSSSQTWTPNATPLSTDVIETPAVLLDTSGNSVVVWNEGSNQTIQSSISTLAGPWMSLPSLSATSGTITPHTPLVATSSVGSSIAIWEEVSTGGTSTIWFTFRQGVPLPPTNLVANLLRNKFLTQERFSQVITWSPSPTPNVVSYEIYSNAALTNLLGTVSGSGPYQFVVNAVNPKAESTYYVVAVNSLGIKSAPAVIVVPSS